jgi:hypothetical protein
MRKKVKMGRGSGNVFRDLGFSEAGRSHRFTRSMKTDHVG